MIFGQFTVPDDHVVLKTNLSYVFVNIRPFLPYHLLVSPIRKVPNLLDLNDEEYVDLFLTVKKVIRGLKPFGEAFTVSVQDGKAAGQTVDHVHVHFLPRKMGDLENNNDIYREISLDNQRENRSYETMKEEAFFLRSFIK